MPSTVMIALDSLTIDADIQPRRDGINDAHVAAMVAYLADGKDLPAVRVFRLPGGEHKLTRGFHRAAAYTDAGRTHIPAEVREGDDAAAGLDAAGSATEHQARHFSNDDKRQAVRLALHYKPEWTDRQVADWCGVHHQLVSDVRAAFAAENVDDSSTLFPTDEKNEDSVPVATPAKKGRKGSEKKRKKEDHAKKAASLLLKGCSRTDDDIAKEIGCGVRVVGIARKALEEKGRIPPQPPPAKKPKAAEPAANNPDTIVITEQDEKDELARREPPKDGVGQVIPLGLRDTFLDPELGEAIADLTRLHDELDGRYQRILRSLSKKPYPFCSFGEITHALNDVVNPKSGKLPHIIALLTAGVPFAVCTCGKPRSEHKVCRTGGYLPRWRFDELKAQGERK